MPRLAYSQFKFHLGVGAGVVPDQGPVPVIILVPTSSLRRGQWRFDVVIIARCRRINKHREKDASARTKHELHSKTIARKCTSCASE